MSLCAQGLEHGFMMVTRLEVLALFGVGHAGVLRKQDLGAFGVRLCEEDVAGCSCCGNVTDP